MTYRILDLFCGGGGASVGYARAGLTVVGIDNEKQGNYPYRFVRKDAMAVLNYMVEHGPMGFDAIHASPPCQHFSQIVRTMWKDRVDSHPDLLTPTRELLDEIGLPYVLENVDGAPMRHDLMLCGTMFRPETNIKKHRFFEANWPLPEAPGPCDDHASAYNPWKGKAGERSAVKFRAAMGIDWLPINGGMSRKNGYTGDLSNAIPPAYTEYIGKALIEYLQCSKLSASKEVDE